MTYKKVLIGFSSSLSCFAKWLLEEEEEEETSSGWSSQGATKEGREEDKTEGDNKETALLTSLMAALLNMYN